MRRNNIAAGSLQAFLFSTVLPVIAAATLSGYFFLRRSTPKESSEIAVEVLAELPDPGKSR